MKEKANYPTKNNNNKNNKKIDLFLAFRQKEDKKNYVVSLENRTSM